jgi:nucleotide-binding universal stress UspA family protein
MLLKSKDMNTHAILGTDFPSASDKLLSCLGEYKKIGIEKITLVHALGIKNIQAFEDFLRRGTDQRISEQKAILEKQGFEVEVKIVPGIPATELEALAKKLDSGMIIIGSRGATLTKVLLGSTASEILHNLQSPVLLAAMRVVEKDEAATCELNCENVLGHVMLATDFSDFSEAAFQWIKDRAIAMPKVTLMHVQDEVKIGGHLLDKLEEFNRIDRGRLERLKKSLEEAHPETAVDIVIEYGKPLQCILRFIKENEVTLTVMGSQGRGVIPGIFLGSVSYQVARHSESNLMLIPLPRIS